MQSRTIIESVRIGPWKCRRIIMVEEFSGFPKCIACIIAEYCSIPTLLPWINKNLLDMDIIGENPRSVEAGLIDVRMKNAYTVSNPETAEYIKQNISRYEPIEYNSFLWGNPALFDWLREHYPDECIDLGALMDNTCPSVITFILDRHLSVTDILSENNPIAFEYFQKIRSSNEIAAMYGNPAAIDYLGDFTGHGCELSENPHPRAIEYLRTHQDEIYWPGLSKNPGIFEYRPNPELLELLSE
jgi:hypothetical protein